MHFHLGEPALWTQKFMFTVIPQTLLLPSWEYHTCFADTWFFFFLQTDHLVWFCWFGVVFLIIGFLPWIWAYGLKMKEKLGRKFWLKKKKAARRYPQVHQASEESSIRDQSVLLSTRQIAQWHRQLLLVSDFCHGGMILSSFLANK